MPKLSDTMEEGKILHWLKRPGDQVRPGEPLAEVETDKADMVLEAFEGGVLQELRLSEGQSAPVGAVIALLGAPGETAAPQPHPAPPLQAQSVEDVEVVEEPQPRRPAAPAIETPHGAGAGPRLSLAHSAPESTRRANAPSTETPAAEVTDSESFLSATDEERSGAPIGAEAPAPAVEVAPTPAAHEPRAIWADNTPPRIRVTPLARRAAEEAGIDLSSIRGTGVEGRITKRDVDSVVRARGAAARSRSTVAETAAAQSEAGVPAVAAGSDKGVVMSEAARNVAPGIPTFERVPGTYQPNSRMRRAIAQRLTASKQEIPHYYVTVEVDMEEAVRLKKSLESTKLFDQAITYNDIVVKACALALGRHPHINSSFSEGSVKIHPTINIGMAVAVEDGLIVPVIKDCQRLSLPEIARQAHGLAAKAQQGGFTTEELSGGTFTISNMGMLGIEHFVAVINPPQAAILAVAAIKERPVLRNGQVVVGTTMMMTLSCDHRIIDGVVAGRFLLEVKRFLENPPSLLM